MPDERNVKNSFQLLLAVLVLLSILITSCSKDSGITDIQTRINILTSKKWRATSLDIGGGVFMVIPNCELDDYTEFKPSGFYEVFGGTIKCNTSEQEIIDFGSWILSQDGNILTYNHAKDYTVIELTSNTLKVEYSEFFGKIIKSFYGY